MGKYFPFILLSLLLFFNSCKDNVTEVSDLSTRGPQFQWIEASLKSQHIDSVKIDSAISRCKVDENIYSFVLIRNGFLVKEYYQSRLHAYNEFEIRSATKSFISVLVGIALDRGLIDSVDQPMISFFPEFDSPQLDPRTRMITVRHLLTMRAGFDYSDVDPTPNLYTATDHWVKQTIELPLKYPPGERFYYASVQTHLLSAIITKRSGMSTLEFGEKYLFDSAGIHIGHWDQDPQGVYFGGSGMMMTARDMARFGDFVLKNGAIDNVPFVAEHWIQQSIIPNNVNNGSWGNYSSINYGFLWWTNISSKDSFYFAAGSGGQFIVIIPSKSTVIVTTANPNIGAENIEKQELEMIDIITTYLIPSLQ